MDIGYISFQSVLFSVYVFSVFCLTIFLLVLIFVKFNKWERRGGGLMNEKKDKCLILMLNLKVSKQTRSEASKNEVIIKRVSNISINSVNLSK